MTVTKYKLKKGQPGFQVVDGPMRGHVFEPNLVYVSVPDRHAGRFDAVNVPAPGENEHEAQNLKKRKHGG